MAFVELPGKPKVRKNTSVWDLNPKPRDFKSRLGGCETCVINSKLFSKTDLKTEMTLSLIHRFNLRLGGYSIWSASTSRTISEGEIRG